MSPPHEANIVSAHLSEGKEKNTEEEEEEEVFPAAADEVGEAIKEIEDEVQLAKSEEKEEKEEEKEK